MLKINTAIVGIGNIGYELSFDKKRKNSTWSHFSAYKKIKDSQLVAVVDNDLIKLRKFKIKNPKINCYSNIREMLQSEKIDLVSICTPPRLHYYNIITLLKNGIKAIICEKPMVENITQARKIYNLTKNKIFFLNHQRRYDQNYQKLKKIITPNNFGRLRSVTVYYPGQIYNILSHVIDIVRYLINLNPLKVSFVERNYNEKEKSATGYILFEKDIIVNIISTGKRENLIFELDFISDKSRIKIKHNGKKILLSKFKKSPNYSGYFELSNEKKIKVFKSDPLLNLIKNAVRSVKLSNNKHNISKSIDGFYVISTIKAVENSIKNNGKLFRVQKL